MIVEYTIDALGQEELIGKMSKPAREFCNQIWETGEGLSVETVQKRLEKKNFSLREIEFWKECFEQDNHILWKDVKEESDRENSWNVHFL